MVGGGVVLSAVGRSMASAVGVSEDEREIRSERGVATEGARWKLAVGSWHSVELEER